MLCYDLCILLIVKTFYFLFRNSVINDEGQEFTLDESVDLSNLKIPFTGLAEICYRKIINFNRMEEEMSNINYLHYLLLRPDKLLSRLLFLVFSCKGFIFLAFRCHIFWSLMCT